MYHLRELRIQKGLTQAELSKALQVSASSIGMYEQGRREPDNETLGRIANFFNVTTDYLLGRTDEPGGFQKGLLWDINDDSPLAQKAMEGMSNGWLPMSKTENLEAEKALEWLEKYNKLDINDKNTINSMIDIALRSKEKQSNE